MKSNDMNRYIKYYENNDEPPRNGTVKITFFGATTLLIDDGATQIMSDGFFTRPSRWQMATSKISTDRKIVDAVLKRFEVNRLQGLFVMHSHYDHAFDAPYVARQTGAKLYGSPSTINVGIGGGLTEDQMELFDPGKEMKFGEFRVTILESQHAHQKIILDDTGEVIERPLEQPARVFEYKEGGSYDILIKHGAHSILVKPSAHFVKGALDNVQAEILLLGVASLGRRRDKFRESFYDQTVAKIKPKLLIPIHWDDITKPLSDNLPMIPWWFDDTEEAFDFLIERTHRDNIEFSILQGFKSILLLEDEIG